MVLYIAYITKLIHSFKKYLPSSYYVPGTVPSDERTAGNSEMLALKRVYAVVKMLEQAGS